VMRIQRVVEIEHPGVDVAEEARRLGHRVIGLSDVVLANARTRTPCRLL
jgi:hypothetical protein